MTTSWFVFSEVRGFTNKYDPKLSELQVGLPEVRVRA